MTNNRSPQTGCHPNEWWRERSFKFYCVPKPLIENSHYKSLSPEAAMLYGMLFDRAHLSAKHAAFLDKDGRIYVVYTNQEICKRLRCGHEKATRLLKELEQHRLIAVDRSHRTSRANLIYVLPFKTTEVEPDIPVTISDFQTHDLLASDFQTPSPPEIISDGVRKSDTNNTDSNNTDTNYTEYFSDVWSVEEIRQKVKQWIGYEELFDNENYRQNLDLAVSVMTDIFSNRQSEISVGKKTYPRRDVNSRLLQIDKRHLLFVLESMSRMQAPVKNPGAFILTQLFYAPVNIHRLSSDEIFCDVEREASGEVMS